jgi:hypothetical protein
MPSLEQSLRDKIAELQEQLSLKDTAVRNANIEIEALKKQLSSNHLVPSGPSASLSPSPSLYNLAVSHTLSTFRRPCLLSPCAAAACMSHAFFHGKDIMVLNNFPSTVALKNIKHRHRHPTREYHNTILHQGLEQLAPTLNLVRPHQIWYRLLSQQKNGRCY